MRAIRGVLLDIDGTLVDSNDDLRADAIYEDPADLVSQFDCSILNPVTSSCSPLPAFVF